ncbi:hypothetical protein KSD_75050 [Ktedonobacter sp. SOSP1-85]|uniref:hypothetical protein n=1 Tax=Ktedonobacter sp. SOSP1-85 TaxID=2778367 RepID=UPI001915ED4B|nr:hypothetical protein [Ktedonobacter sp. SOSP1-85]GHO79734.1 hypothetical protein KSD_75050 [Ktedonobacter sp. SOSP1-85]
MKKSLRKVEGHNKPEFPFTDESKQECLLSSDFFVRSERYATLTLAQFEEHFRAWVLESYHHCRQRRLRGSPLDRWRQGATKERLRHAIYAIMQWNRANEPRRRWFLNVSLVKALAGGRKDLIGTVLKEYQADVDQHHQELDIPRGYNKHSELVQEDIQLPEESDASHWNRPK